MKLTDQRGVALVLALAVIALLCALMVDFSYTMMVDMTLAANMRDEYKALYAACSGIELARYRLQRDDPAYDSLDEEWAELATHPGFLSDDDEGKFKVAIEDEAGKIAINKLVVKANVDPVIRGQLQRLFEVLELEPQLLDPIIDWLDPDNNAQPFGAEDAYYQGLLSPYPCKNAPLAALEELLLVKGMTREILYGTAEKKGLIHYLTLYSDGQVNINTASVEVLQSLSDKIDRVTAQAIIDYRQDRPVKEIKYDDIKSLPGMTLDIFNDIRDQCDVKSSYFSLRVEGKVREIRKVVSAVLKRSSAKEVKPVFWRVE
jgi:general secretion pathway protein K